MCDNHFGLQRDQFFREYLCLRTGRRKPSVDANIAAFRLSTFFQPLPECREASPCPHLPMRIREPVIATDFVG
jgi:hypothetical protein